MIQAVQMEDDLAWDRYVAGHPSANAYHASHWMRIIAGTYSHKVYALAAVSTDDPSASKPAATDVKGILPLVHLKTPFVGNRLVSMPFFDHGGILADDEDCEKILLQAALALGRKLKVAHIELRHLEKITSLNDGRALSGRHEDSDPRPRERLQASSPAWSLRSHKVRLLMPLPDASETLMKSFKSKLRSQIKRPIKAGLTAVIGRAELLDAFYTVFCINMRDLGSPVHARALIRSALESSNDATRIAVVYKDHTPVAASLLVGFKDVMLNPWASSLRRYSKESPNMLLYWTMLAHAADHGYRFFDFGRSTPGEGTYRFKLQWGAEPHPMYWYTIWLNQNRSTDEAPEASSPSAKRAAAVKLWQKLPVGISRVIGPSIRKHIDL